MSIETTQATVEPTSNTKADAVERASATNTPSAPRASAVSNVAAQAAGALSPDVAVPATRPARVTAEERAIVVADRSISVAHARLEALFDESTFDEIGAGVLHRCDEFGLAKRRTPGDGVVTGMGLVNGRTVYAYAQDKTVLGGSLGEAHAHKIARLMDLAGNAGAPFIAINDSGGARIQEGIESLGGYGEIFRRNVKFSGVIPQIALICGPCAGGAVYSPALMDFVGMVDQSSYMFLTGPKVVKTVTFEDVTVEELGGARTHSSTTGVSNLMFPTDLAAIEGVKRLLGYLPNNCNVMPERIEPTDPVDRPITDIASVFPESPRTPYDVREIVNRVIDADSFFEVHAHWAPNIVVGFARIDGRVAGIVANQPLALAGCLDIDASRKGARFIRTCNAFNIPLVSLVDVPGFLPGVEQEHKGVIDHGAKLLYAYCEATVPKVSVIMRKAYGGAYIVMSSKHVGGDINLAWPSAEIAVMGAKGAVEVLFRKQIAASDDPATAAVEAEANYKEKFLNPRQALSRGFVDAVIEPSTTRVRIARALRHLEGKVESWPARRCHNMPT